MIIVNATRNTQMMAREIEREVFIGSLILPREGSLSAMEQNEVNLNRPTLVIDDDDEFEDDLDEDDEFEDDDLDDDDLDGDLDDDDLDDEEFDEEFDEDEDEEDDDFYYDDDE
jgi:hypothetical protein